MTLARFSYLSRKFIRFLQVFPLFDAVKIVVAFFFDIGVLSVWSKVVKQRIFIRSKTSDVRAAGQVLVMEDYDIAVPHEVRYIVDAGANVGFSALYFASKYPTAKIVAIEPDIGNFSMLKRNTEHCQNVQSLQAAIWNVNGCLRIRDLGRGSWGFVVEKTIESDPDRLQGISMEGILAQFDLPRIDILKMDIEGAEAKLFMEGSSLRWLDLVNALIIELHEYDAPGITDAVDREMKARGFLFSQSGENQVWIRSPA